VLRAIPGVTDGHVAGEPGSAQLVAWWTGDPTTDVVSALRARLPEEAIPVRVQRLATIPLTARGKVDAEALWRSSAEPDAAARPAVGNEALLRMLLERVSEQQLGLVLRPDDNFFDAGLTSLNLLRLHDAMRSDIGAAITVADFFRFPTARRLSEHAATGRATADHGPRRAGRADFSDELRRRRAARSASDTTPE